MKQMMTKDRHVDHTKSHFLHTYDFTYNMSYTHTLHSLIKQNQGEQISKGVYSTI